MSRVLGPIHNWLWQKITLVKQREDALLEALYDKFGAEAVAVAGKPRPSSLPPKEDIPLGDLIGEYNIHYWLNNAIQETETSEAAVVTAFINKYGDEALAVITNVYREEGKRCGQIAVVDQEERRKSARGSFELLHSVMLDGMPCDQVTEVPENSAGRVVFIHNACLHMDNWAAAKADPAVMCRLYGEWTGSVMSAINEGLKHERQQAIAFGQSPCRDVFTLGV